jgi:hypothetical protein
VGCTFRRTCLPELGVCHQSKGRRALRGVPRDRQSGKGRRGVVLLIHRSLV